MYCGPQSHRIRSPRATSLPNRPKAWRQPFRIARRAAMGQAGADLAIALAMERRGRQHRADRAHELEEEPLPTLELMGRHLALARDRVERLTAQEPQDELRFPLDAPAFRELHPLRR